MEHFRHRVDEDTYQGDEENLGCGFNRSAGHGAGLLVSPARFAKAKSKVSGKTRVGNEGI
jgi:hypothetical protein